MDECRFYLFGPPHLRRNGQLITIPRRKQWGLLTYLLMTRRSHERDTLATLFWPAYSQSRARADLRRELARLHGALPGVLLSNRTEITLRAEAHVWVDVWAFEQHLAAVKAHSHAPNDFCAACLEHLRAARELYADDLLAGYALRDSPGFEDWHFFQQESLRSQLLEVLSYLAQMEMAGADPSLAIALLRERLAIDPLHEESHRRLIWVYAHTGQRAAALRQFHECQAALANELGAAPAPETISLYQQIAKLAAAPPTAPAPEGVRGPRHWGFSNPQQEFTARPFIGRDRHLAQLEAQFDAACDGNGRVVFVSGEAGAGKTTLLCHFARQAMAKRSELIVAGGCGTAPYGADALLIPFRDLFAMMVGDFEHEWTESMPSGEQLMRLRTFFPHVVHALVTVGPHLVDSLIASNRLLARAAEAYLDETDDYERLRALVLSQHEQAVEPESHHLIFTEVGAVLHALSAQRPLLLLLDNLQWADMLSFDLLFHLGKRLSAQPILIVGAYRPSEIVLNSGARSHRNGLPVHHPLIALTHEFTRDFGAVQVDLDAEASSADMAWLDALLGAESCQLSPELRNTLFAQTHGHPLFSIELLQLWRERGWLRRNAAGFWVDHTMPDLGEVPLKAAAAIQRRLDGLSEEATRLLMVASVEGETFTIQAIAAVQGWSERQTLELLATQLHHLHHLVAEVEAVDAQLPTRYRFVNPMIRTYVYNQLDHGERRLLHDAFEQALRLFSAGDP